MILIFLIQKRERISPIIYNANIAVLFYKQQKKPVFFTKSPPFYLTAAIFLLRQVYSTVPVISAGISLQRTYTQTSAFSESAVSFIELACSSVT